MSQPTISQQEIKSYRPGLFRSSQEKYERDLKRHTDQGWKLVTYTLAGRDIFAHQWFTATYER